MSRLVFHEQCLDFGFAGMTARLVGCSIGITLQIEVCF
jgi:hypothetical protein